MAYVAPSTKTTGAVVSAADWNQDVAANAAAIYAGAMGIASQAALDFIYASSSGQLARLAKGTALQYPRINAAASGWEFGSPAAAIYAATLANVANTASETTVLSFVVPANAWADGDVIDTVAILLHKNNKGTNGTVAIKVNCGAGAQVVIGADDMVNNASEYTHTANLRLQRFGSTVVVWNAVAVAYSTWYRSGNASSVPCGTSTPTNFTSDVTVSVKVTLGAADASFYIKPQVAKIIHYRS